MTHSIHWVLAWPQSAARISEVEQTDVSLIHCLYGVFLLLILFWEDHFFIFFSRVYAWKDWDWREQDTGLVYCPVPEIWNNNGWPKGTSKSCLCFIQVLLSRCCINANFASFFSGRWLQLQLWWLPQVWIWLDSCLIVLVNQRRYWFLVV